MENNESQRRESLSQVKQSESQPQHIRPKIQRKSPNTAKQRQDNSSNDVTTTLVEIEETRKRMESWMGLGSKNVKQTSNNQKTREKDSSANKSSIKNKINVTVSHQRQPPRQQQQKQPVSILKNPKYSRTSPIMTVESSSTSATTNRISVGGSATDIATGAPLEGQLASTQQQHQSSTVIDNLNGAMNDREKFGSLKENKSGFICKDVVVERDPTIAATKRKSFRRANKNNVKNDKNQQTLPTVVNNHASIEGYVPAMSGMQAPIKLNRGVKKGVNDDASENLSSDAAIIENDKDPLVINSLEGLMRAAGENLPENPNKISDDTKMVEADISFSVMTQDQYESKLPVMKKEHEEERKRQTEIFMGKHDIFGDDDESIEGALDGDVIDNDDDDDAVMELLLGSDIDSDDEKDDDLAHWQPEIRAFTLIWDALTNWMTHDTVLWVQALRDGHHKNSSSGENGNNNANASEMPDNNNNLKNIDTEWSPMVDRSDIGASRCAGVLAMIRLYLGQCMEELNHPLEWRRKAEKRLNDIMRTFDYSRENPKLSAAHWRCMACVLLDVVLIETREADPSLILIPPSVANIGMNKEEFEYLSRKAVSIFE